jgi:hypothetical protein
MPEAVEPVGERTQQPFVPGRPGQGWQRRVDKLTRRIRLLQDLVGKLEARCGLQEAMLDKFKQRETEWKRSKVRR